MFYPSVFALAIIITTLAVLVLHHFLDFSLVVMSGDYSPVAMHWLLIAVTSLVEL